MPAQTSHRLTRAVAIAAALIGVVGSATADQWFTSQAGAQLRFNYGTPSNAPQYGVLDLASSYLRLNYGPASGWGTSIDTMPSYWTGGKLYQGYPITASAQVMGSNLFLTVDGTTNGMHIHETISIVPPLDASISATVVANLTGMVSLDTNRPGEAFKPVFLSSMHDSVSSWDAMAPFVGRQIDAFPVGGWIITPAQNVVSTVFGLLGGTSMWKQNAPFVQIRLSSPMQIAGWLATDSNPNDDNVGFWAATSVVLPSWRYQIIATSRLPFATLAPPVVPAPPRALQ